MKAIGSTSVCVVRCVLIAAIGLSVAGCSSGPPGSKTAKVTGKVTFNGQPVTSGVVNFYDAAKGQQSQGTLGADGTYSVTAVVGTYSVSVAPPPFAGGMGPDGKALPAPPEPENIPKKYRSAETSGLTTTVKEGANTFPIEMDDK